MNIHEYQAKQILRDKHINVANGQMVESAQAAINAAASLKDYLGQPLKKVVLKAQIHAGGRGKAGGVKVCSTTAEITDFCNNILNKPLVTKQTGPQGQLVSKIYVEEPATILKEFYLALVLNRNLSQICIVASASGGMDIEAVAEETPELIISLPIISGINISNYHGRLVAKTLGISHLTAQLTKLLKQLYQLYVELDASLIEINPLALNDKNELIVLDAKISFDDNALYRQTTIRELRDDAESDPLEVEAAKHDLNYIKLDGNIGCMVNGAGLAMATMDIIKHYGAAPANFLDVGGSATEALVSKAFEIILKDKNVKVILVNIFGGIMRCDIIAQGIINAAKSLKLNIPLVVRLEGTNQEQGNALLNSANLNIINAFDLDDAAQKAVKALNNEKAL